LAVAVPFSAVDDGVVASAAAAADSAVTDVFVFRILRTLVPSGLVMISTVWSAEGATEAALFLTRLTFFPSARMYTSPVSEALLVTAI